MLLLNNVLAGSTEAYLSAAQQAVVSARASLQTAHNNLSNLKNGPTQDQVTTAKASVEKAKAALAQAQGSYDKVAWRPDIGALPEALALQQATIDYQAALASYNTTMAPPKVEDIAADEKNLESAQAALDAAQKKLALLQPGRMPLTSRPRATPKPCVTKWGQSALLVSFASNSGSGD